MQLTLCQHHQPDNRVRHTFHLTGADVLLPSGKPDVIRLHPAGGSQHAGALDADAGHRAMGTRFVAEPLRAELQQRAYAVAAQLDPESQAQVVVWQLSLRRRFFWNILRALNTLAVVCGCPA